jgi:hypothetical protein
MALFGSSRDANLIKHMSRELMQRIIGIEVEYYKLSLADTKTNIYNESGQKTYYHPMRVYSLVQREDKTAKEGEVAIDFDKLTTFSFLRDDLVTMNLVVETGDIVKWDGGFYEIDLVRESDYWVGRNPDRLIGVVQNEIPDYGYSISVVAESHLTRANALNLVETRSGINSIKTKNNLPRNL